MKYAVFTMDIEDWYHSDYFLDKDVDHSYSMLDGIDRFITLLSDYNIKSTLFVLSGLVDNIKNKLIDISSMGHEIGSHGDDHTRPLKIDVNCFKSRMITSKKKIEDTLSVSVNGYRAPSFSLDRERLDIVREVGFIYDSSKNPFQEHPLYGKIDMSGFQKICSNVYRYNDFLEFETNAVPLMNKSIPVSGGAYIRVFPWMITKKMIRECVKYNEYYVFYIHPFEVSSSSTPYLDSDISLKTKMRFSLGRSTVENKIKKLIEFLREEGFKFLTFSEVRSMVLKNDIDINRL